MRGWAALAWAIGLSPRSASRLLAAFGVSVSRMSARRGVQEAGRNARRKQAGGARGRATVTGEDETVVRVNGEKIVVVVVTDAAPGEVLGLEALAERDSDGFHGVAWRLRARLRGRGDGRGRPEYLQAGGRASGNRASDLHSPREEAGAEPSRRDRRLGLGQGEDMATADGAVLRRRLGASAFGARCSGQIGYVGPDRGATPRPLLGEPRPPKPAPKSPTVSGTVTPIV